MRLAATIRAFVVFSFVASIGASADEVYARSWGPAVGTELATFTLSDQAGEKRSFTDLASDRGLLIVFVRSGDW